MPKTDVLQLPLIGQILRWRWGRLVFQILFTLILALIIYDGFTGPQLAPANNATVLAWVHYRGIIILTLLFAGNFFCLGCPFTLPRTLLHRFSIHGKRWPAKLRNKWVAIGSIFFIFWLYEWLDLWASPLLTAWVAIAYVLLAFVLELVFRESAFCKYVCPLGTFNFVYSLASPLQIQDRDAETCRSCEGKECVNGSKSTLGCGTELYVPMITSNMDCTFCLDCARACPYENIALAPRKTGTELLQPPRPPRWDRAFLLISLGFFGLSNAFGMVPPVYTLQTWMTNTLRIESDGFRLLIIFGFGSLLIPALLIVGLTRISGYLSGSKAFKQIADHYAGGLIPIGFSIWLAHYGFHLAIGGASIVPVFQSFLLDHGITLLGMQPNWELSFLLPQDWIFPLQVIAILLGFAVSLVLSSKIALQRNSDPKTAFQQLLPWVLLITLITIAALSIFNLPMEMRGTRMLGI